MAEGGEKSAPLDQHKTLKSTLHSKPDRNKDTGATGTDNVVASPSDQHSSKKKSKLERHVSGRSWDSESDNSRQTSPEGSELERHIVSEMYSDPESDNSRKTSPENLDAPLKCLKAEKGKDFTEGPRNLKKRKVRFYYLIEERSRPNYRKAMICEYLIQSPKGPEDGSFAERLSKLEKNLAKSSWDPESDRSKQTTPEDLDESLLEPPKAKTDQCLAEKVSKQERHSTRSDRKHTGARSKRTSRKDLDEPLPDSPKAETGKDFTKRKSGMSKEHLDRSSRVHERSGRTCPKRSAERLPKRSEEAQDFTERVSKQERDFARRDRRREDDRSRPTSRKEFDESLPQSSKAEKGKDFTRRKSGMSKEHFDKSSRVHERSGRTCPKRSAEHLWERSEDAEDFTERVSKQERDFTRRDRRREGDRSRPTSRKEFDESLPTSSKAEKGKDFTERKPGRPRERVNCGKARSSAPFRRKLRDVVQTPNELAAQMIIEKVCIMYSRSEFTKAIELLDDYNVAETNLYMANLQLVECCVHAGRSYRARQQLEKVGKILITLRIPPKTVLNCVESFSRKSRYTRTVVLKRIASDMFRLSPSSPRVLMVGIYKCLEEISNTTLPMIMEGGDRRRLGLMFGVEFMIDIYKALKKVTNVNLAEKALLKCSSCLCIALNFFLADKFKESVRYCLDGIRILETKFGENASNYAVHSLLLQKAGVCWFTEGKFRLAERSYLKAIRTIKAAACFCSEDDRKRALASAKRDLRQARELLRQESED